MYFVIGMEKHIINKKVSAFGLAFNVNKLYKFRFSAFVFWLIFRFCTGAAKFFAREIIENRYNSKLTFNHSFKKIAATTFFPNFK